MGNPLLGNDGVGFHIAQELARKIKDKNIDVKDTSLDGLGLLDLILGYDKVVIVDAILAADEKEIGQIHRLGPEDVVRAAPSDTLPHNANLATTIQIGKELLAEQMPREIVIFAVGIQEATEFTEKMTEKVKKAVPRAVSLILQEIAAT